MQCLCSLSGAVVSQWKFPPRCWIGWRRPSPWRRPPLWFDMPTFRPCWGPSEVGHTRDFILHVEYTDPQIELNPYSCVTLFLLVLGDTLAQASGFMPLLLQTLEKAVAQNSQHALLAEGVAASVLLSRLAVLETHTGKFGISTITFYHFWRLLKNSVFMSSQRRNSATSGTWSWMRRSRFSPQRSSSPRPTKKVRQHIVQS